MSASVAVSQTPTPEVEVRHCMPLESDWQKSDAPSRTSTTEGSHLTIAISVFGIGEKSIELADPQGEEVATVLEGEFLIEAAGERHELSPGEGIIIPPREPRVWTCQSARGVLYRVTTRLDVLTATEGSAT
jgi:quercetin dioxygenase-like cupin family protein